jgi:TonB-dependent starch-binding outer membrane protein SusC
MQIKRLLLVMLVFAAGISFAQAQTDVSGRVTDARDGSPLANVSVTAKGARTGTSTDADGRFRINVPANATLVFSSIGFGEKEVRVTGGSVNVSLEVSTTVGQEVIVTGYNTATRKQLAASIAKVGGDEVKLQPVATFDQMLTGKTPGVLIQSQSGQPGASASNITIRGKGSVLASTQPLFIVDGIQVTGADFQSINPADVESYSILKDAVATSQYGSRGANGVIVVTTKRGANAKTKINYDFQYGIGSLPDNKLKLMNSAEKIFFEMNYDTPYGTNFFGWTQAEADSLAKVDAGWEDVMFRKAKTQQHILSMTGGNDKTKFFISGSIFDQEGLVIATNLKRYTGRINVDHSVNNNLKVSLTTFVGSSSLTNTSENDQYIGDPLNAIRWANPYVTPYNPDGSYNHTDLQLQGQPNALEELLENPGKIIQFKGIAAASVEYKFPFLKGLSAKTQWGADYTDNSTTKYFDPSTYQGSQQVGTDGSWSRGSLKRVRYTGTTSLSYGKTSGDHTYRVSLFNEYINRRTTTFNYTGFGITGVFGNGADVTPGTPTNGYIPVVGDGHTEQSLMSYFALADYSFRNKYFINGSFRRDGSSRLAEGNQWVNYAGLGAAWLVSSEDFLANSKWLNELRVKVSYGSAGNEEVGDSYEAREQFGGVTYNGFGGLILNNLEKPNLTWEVRKTLNAGIDFGLWKNRLTGTIEFYNATTDGLYLNRQLSGTNGVTSILDNLGKIRNQGIEISIGGDIIRSKDFTWNLSANYTYNKSKVVALEAGQTENVAGLGINRVGERLNSIYIVRYAGVDPANGDALYYKTDGKTTTNAYDPNDKVIAGTFDPPHFGAINTAFSYKGFELTAQFNFMAGHYIFNNDRGNVENPTYVISNISRDLLRQWAQPGDITDIPDPNNNFELSTTRFLEKGDFFRFRNVMLSYGLPSRILSKIKVNGVRVFVQGQNLYTWSKFKGYDPEVATGILAGSQYPQLKTITFGVSVGL